MEYEYLEDLVTFDFSAPCAAGRTFCSVCRQAVCHACCPDHAASQHGVVGGARRTIDVALLDGRFPAVTALAVRTGGLGFDWTGIQRLDHHGTSYVALGRLQPNWNRARLKGNCTACNDRIQIKMDHCSPTCKIAAVQRGQSRDVIQSLVSCDFTQTHLLDRFCTGCRRAFSSHFCADHAHHHPGPEEFHVFTIVRQDGWLLIPEEQLPPPLVSAVKTVISVDGVVMVPLRPRSTPHPDGGTRQCLRCQNMVEDQDRFCSLRCKAY